MQPKFDDYKVHEKARFLKMTNPDNPDHIVFPGEPDAKLSQEYKDAPSVENYLRLRREHPDKEIEFAVSGGIDWLFTNEKLILEHGISPQLVAYSLDADPKNVSKLSLILMERLSDRDRMRQEGKTHIASRGEGISDALVNYLIALMIDAHSWNDDLEFPRDLLMLIRHQLLKGEKTLFDKQLHSKYLRKSARIIAAQMLEQGEPISMRQIAHALKKNVSTLSRLFPDNSLEKEAGDFLENYRMFTKSQTPFADSRARNPLDSDE